MEEPERQARIASRVNWGGVAAKVVVLLGLWLFVGTPHIDWWRFTGAFIILCGLDLVRGAYRSEQ